MKIILVGTLNTIWFTIWYLAGFPLVAVLTGVLTIMALDIWVMRASRAKVIAFAQYCQKVMLTTAIFNGVGFLFTLGLMWYMGWAGLLVVVGSMFVAHILQQHIKHVAEKKMGTPGILEVATIPLCPNCQEYAYGPGNPNDWCDKCTHLFGTEPAATPSQ